MRFLIVPAVLAASLAIPSEAAAQRRVIRRPAPRSVVYVAARPYYYRPYYYSPAFGLGFGGYAGWYSWYGGPWYGYGYPYYAQFPYPYGGRYYRDYTSAARLEVKPREAEVFIDGYFVGAVDDFDGWLQRLHVEPGEHELVIYLKGHRTFRQNVLFRPGATLKVEHIMQPLAGGEAEEARPVPNRAAGRSPVRRDPQDYPPPRDYPPDDRRQPGDPVPAPRRDAPEPPQSDQYGSVTVRVQPIDAEVLVDGESWRSPDAGSITLQLSEGVHKIEVRKAGYRTYTAEVRVRRGDSTSVNVSLSRN
jgi:hypothetical protein